MTGGDHFERTFFERPSDAVARDLVGTVMALHGRGRAVEVLVAETEAYGGLDDPASHAFRGPTARNEIMFGPAGYLYVYLIYGVHWCMNVVTGRDGDPSAVLLRAGQLLRPRDGQSPILRGPGNLTRGLDVTGADNGRDCCQTRGRGISFHPSTEPVDYPVASSVRIGLSVAKDRRSRYFLDGHPAVSRLPSARRRL